MDTVKRIEGGKASPQSWQGTVLVTGAAGNLGHRVVKKLVARDIPVRAFVRNAEQAPAMEALGAEVALGDVTDAASLVDAMMGIKGVISAVGTMRARRQETPQTVDLRGNMALVDLAVREQVRHFVLISIIGAPNLRQSILFRAKYHAEQYLRQVGIPYTVLRSAPFMPDFTTVLQRGANRGRYNVIGGSLTQAKGYISPDDLAELAVRSLWEPGAYAKTLNVTNDERLTPERMAAIHSRLFNRPIRLRRLPVPLLKGAKTIVQPINSGLADFLGFLQAVGEDPFAGQPDEILDLFPGFTFESYESYLQRTRPL